MERYEISRQARWISAKRKSPWNKGTSKNDEGRVYYTSKELKRMLSEMLEERGAKSVDSDLLLLGNTGEDRIIHLRRAWNNACRRAGLGCGYSLNKQYVEK